MSHGTTRCRECGATTDASGSRYALCADCQLEQRQAEESVNDLIASMLAAA
jgi:hypothetical protein